MSNLLSQLYLAVGNSRYIGNKANQLVEIHWSIHCIEDCFQQTRQAVGNAARGRNIPVALVSDFLDSPMVDATALVSPHSVTAGPAAGRPFPNIEPILVTQDVLYPVFQPRSCRVLAPQITMAAVIGCNRNIVAEIVDSTRLPAGSQPPQTDYELHCRFAIDVVEVSRLTDAGLRRESNCRTDYAPDQRSRMCIYQHRELAVSFISVRLVQERNQDLIDPCKFFLVSWHRQLQSCGRQPDTS